MTDHIGPEDFPRTRPSDIPPVLSVRPRYLTGPNAADTKRDASIDYSIGYCQARDAIETLAKGGAGGQLSIKDIERAIDKARQGLQTMAACAEFVGTDATLPVGG